jgi:hypothetical protein
MCTKQICSIWCVLVLGVFLASIGNAANLVGWWKLDGDLLDSSGLGNHGTRGGDPEFVNGWLGQAVFLDGDDYVTMDGVAGDVVGNDITMSAWVKTTDTTESDWFSVNTAGKGNIILFCINNQVAVMYEGGFEGYATTVVTDGQWHMLTYVRSGPTGYIYVDGLLESTHNASFSLSAGDLWSLGQEWDAGGPSDFLTGTIDEARVYSRTLSAAQVQGLFNGIAPTFAKAENPNPPDGAKNVITPLLEWTAGEGAAFHDVYFGTNPTPSPAEYKGRQTWAVYPLGALTPGITYYWRIDEVEVDGTTIHTGDLWSFKAATLIAYSPSPPDGAKYISLDADLSWAKGITAITHDVYIGTDKTAVAGGTGGTFKANQAATSYKPAGLANDTTYYWRIDEVEADGTTKHTGAVWSFRTRPATAIVDPNLVGWWKLDDEGAAIAVDYSGYDHYGTFYGDPQFVAGIDGDALEFDGINDYVVLGSGGSLNFGATTDFSVLLWVNWTGNPSDPAFISNKNWDSGGNTGYVLAQADNGNTWQWNWNVAGGTRADYDPAGPVLTDGEWHHLCVTHDRDGYAKFYVDGAYQDQRDISGSKGAIDTGMPHVLAQDGTTTYGAIYAGLMDDVRIYNKVLTIEQIRAAMRGDTTQAWDPKPANRSVPDIEQASSLSWSPGDKAAQHDVYLGTDKDAVGDADTSDVTGIYRGRRSAASYSPAALQWGQTYYWRIDEFNTDGTISKGKVWSFTVADYLIVDDFESYTDDVGSRIFQTWRDGWGFSEPAPGYPGNGTGSTVGYAQAPFAEQTIVNGGGQSMPFGYDNTGAGGKARYSETQREWASPQDWTRKAVKALALWFRGYRGSVGSFNYDAGTGIYTMTAAGEDIWGTSDEFHYAFRRLSGIGSIQVKVLSISNTDGWAKAGVMIRDTLDPNSAHTMVVMTPGNGAALQYRGTAGGTSGNANQSGITTPHWVKLERGLGGSFTAYHSSDGKAWTQLGQPVNIAMQSEVFIGFALTSNIPALTCEAIFSDVATAGTVTGQWQSQDIGITSNAPEQLYVALEDSTGKRAVVRHKDPNAVLLDTWQEWNVDLKEFSNAGVNLASIKKMYLGVGDRVNPKAGGTGSLYFDDIRLYRPRCLPSLAKPDADLNGNCVVDYSDLAVMAEDWLLAAADPGGDNLAGWWRFDGDTNDNSGKGIHGKTVGNPKFVAGYDGIALEFDGNDHVVLGTSANLNFADATDFSVALWVKTNGWQNDAAIISNKDWDSGNNTGWAIAGESGGSGSWQWNYKGAIGGRRDYDPPGPTLSDGQWHHLCVTHDRNGYAKFYFDGQYQNQIDISGSTGSINAGYPTVVGTDGAEGKVWAYWFIGLVDDCRIYDKVLTQAEVLYVAGARLRIDLHEDGKIDLKDYAALADAWLNEILWPQP